jgi:uncharacterized membrane protein YdbT with pleckstrin-like domain
MSTVPSESRTPEAVIARLRPHGRAMFLPTVALVAIALAAGYLYGQFDESWQNLSVIGGGVVLAVLLWLLPLLAWLGRHYTITTRRLVLRSGFFVRVRQELLHSRGYDVTVRKRALQSLFRSGDILVNTGLDHPVVLRDVPGADLVQAALHDLMELSQNPVAARRQHEQSASGDERGNDETYRWGAR